MRWVWLAIAVFGFGIAFATHSPGMLAIGLLIGFVALFCTVFSMAAERIESTARSDSAMLTPEVLAQVRERAKAQQSAAASQQKMDQPTSG